MPLVSINILQLCDLWVQCSSVSVKVTAQYPAAETKIKTQHSKNIKHKKLNIKIKTLKNKTTLKIKHSTCDAT